MHEHMAMHKEQERDRINTARMHAARRVEMLDHFPRSKRRLTRRMPTWIATMRSQTARALRRVADSIDSYAGGCVDGQLTCR